jgi:hypothetical protein
VGGTVTELNGKKTFHDGNVHHRVGVDPTLPPATFVAPDVSVLWRGPQLPRAEEVGRLGVTLEPYYV